MVLRVMSAFLGRNKDQVPSVVQAAQQHAVDVLCLQEVMGVEVLYLREQYDFVRFVPMTTFPSGNQSMGLVTCTNLPVFSVHEDYYNGTATELPRFDESTPERVNATKRRPLLTCEVETDNARYHVGNTHFLYSKDGTAGPEHYEAAEKLGNLIATDNYDPLVLCGAMVLARGSTLYDLFVEVSGLIDLVPSNIICTLDPQVHKLAAKLASGEIPPVVVDLIFGRRVNLNTDVRQLFGVSDHTPLIAEIK